MSDYPQCIPGRPLCRTATAFRAEVERLKAELNAERERHHATAGRVERLTAEASKVRRMALMEAAFVFDDRPDIKTAEKRIAKLLKETP